MHLDDVLLQTYNGNPQILAARAALRSVDETYAQAASGFRPSVAGNASYQSGLQTGSGDGTANDSPKTLSLQVSQPLYNGGTTLAAMGAAKNRVMAARAALHATTQKILLGAITAYMDVRRDGKIVRLISNNEDVLASQLAATLERLRLGAVTMTDVRQAETRLSAALADRASADANLKNSSAAFENIIGRAPGDLQPPESRIKLPASLSTAIDDAEKTNPAIAEARFALQAAEADRRALSGKKWPQISLTGQIGRTYDSPYLAPRSQADTAAVMVTATIPFYSGGETDSQIRQAAQVEQEKRMDMYNASRAVHQSVIAAWENLASAKAEMAVRRMGVKTARDARAGVRTEANFGTRTTLDMLNAEQEYLDAEVSYARVIHDKDVATYTLLEAVGRLDPASLHIKNAYDSAAHFQAVRRKWFGTHVRRAAAEDSMATENSTTPNAK